MWKKPPPEPVKNTASQTPSPVVSPPVSLLPKEVETPPKKENIDSQESLVDAPVFFFWGNSTMSFLRFMSIYSACKFNKKVVLIHKTSPSVLNKNRGHNWIIAEDEKMGNDYIPYLGKLKNLEIRSFDKTYSQYIPEHSTNAQTSDLLGWYLMGYEGGTVSDTDIIYRSAVPKIHYDFVYFVTRYYWKPPQFSLIYPVGFLQGRSCNGMKDVYQLAKNSHGLSDHQCCGHTFMSNNINTIASLCTTHVANPLLVYPFLDLTIINHHFQYDVGNMLAYTWSDQHSLDKVCIGIHWWGGVKNSSEWNHFLTHKNYKQYPSHITYIIRSILPDKFFD